MAGGGEADHREFIGDPRAAARTRDRSADRHRTLQSTWIFWSGPSDFRGRRLGCYTKTEISPRHESGVRVTLPPDPFGRIGAPPDPEEERIERVKMAAEMLADLFEGRVSRPAVRGLFAAALEALLLRGEDFETVLGVRPRRGSKRTPARVLMEPESRHRDEDTGDADA